jgi:hypothetical protein
MRQLLPPAVVAIATVADFRQPVLRSSNSESVAAAVLL